MKVIVKIIFVIFFATPCFLLSCRTVKNAEPVFLTSGVSQQLALHRKIVLSKLHYKLAFDISLNISAPITAKETILFDMKENYEPLQIDFKQHAEQLKKLAVNGKDIPISVDKEHIIVNPENLKQGSNQIDFEFIAGDLSLNRNEDYLYTLLVPDRARTVFPCFDQPDLKAVFNLTLITPPDWKVIANGKLTDTLTNKNRKTWNFANSDTISTYLFSFAAGKFNLLSRDSFMPMEFLHRETDPAKLNASVDTIFKLHRDAIRFMQQYTGISYPFQKFGFIAIPDFQYGGMEHVGAIQYRASTLFLDNGATKDQQLARENVISHETAHMWFGDLVTMKWFNDVWMKEVFANFMADKANKGAISDEAFDLKFLIDHFPAAYNVDRTAGSNPIRQKLDNLQDAGTLYGDIIYHKAPVMMRQLERLMGEKNFQTGLQQYLKKFANQNASWPDLIKILDDNTAEDLEKWNTVWTNDTGRPVISYQLKTDGNVLTSLHISQAAEIGKSRIWPQTFEISLHYSDTVKQLTVNLNKRNIELTEAAGLEKPEFIIFNSSGQGYGVFPVDENVLPVLFALKNPILRASSYINLYENMLNGKSISPRELLTIFSGGLAIEKEELNIKLLTGYIGEIFWHYLSYADRSGLSAVLENQILDAIQKQDQPNVKKLLFKNFQAIFTSKTASDKLYQIWKDQKAPQNIKLTEDDYISLSLALALRDNPDTSILSKQLMRITNADRKERLLFITPALSGHPNVRDAFFASLQREKNREKEAWVGAALSYLHHPLRQQTSVNYLQKSLDLLEEIQLTGDIFFPASWLQATFGSYQSKQAAEVLRGFLKSHPNYNPKLKDKILQAADGVFRAEQFLN